MLRFDAREAQLQFDDPINIQYTSGTTGLAQRRDAVAPQHPQQRLLRRRGACATPTHDRICVPVPFYHCFGCVLGNLAALTHGAAIVAAGRVVRSGGDAARDRQPSAARRSTACRRCSSPQLEHPAFDEFGLDSLRTGIMAGAPCPIEVMRQVIDRMHVPEVTICYGMTETSPVSFQSAVDDPIETRVVDGRPRSSARRVQDRRSGDRRHRARAARRASSARAATR